MVVTRPAILRAIDQLPDASAQAAQSHCFELLRHCRENMGKGNWIICQYEKCRIYIYMGVSKNRVKTPKMDGLL